MNIPLDLDQFERIVVALRKTLERIGDLEADLAEAESRIAYLEADPVTIAKQQLLDAIRRTAKPKKAKA